VTHYAIMVRSSYTEKNISSRRLELSVKTVIPSLISQSFKPVIHVLVSKADPLLKSRIDAFESTGCPVVPFLGGIGENWSLPDGRKAMQRLDDDDVISFDFCERTSACVTESGDSVLLWPRGTVFYTRKHHLIYHMKNQFCVCVTERDWHPYRERHHDFCKIDSWENVVVSNDIGWSWIRHKDSVSSTRKVYRKSVFADQREVSERFRISFSDVLKTQSCRMGSR